MKLVISLNSENAHLNEKFNAYAGDTAADKLRTILHNASLAEQKDAALKRYKKRVAELEEKLQDEARPNAPVNGKYVEFDDVSWNKVGNDNDDEPSQEPECTTPSEASETWIPSGILTVKNGIFAGIIGILLLLLAYQWNPTESEESAQTQHTQAIATESVSMDSVAMRTLHRVRALTQE